MNHKIKIAAAGSGILVVAAAVTAIILFSGTEEESSVYRETAVEYGTLTVGITDESSVSIGTVEQTFDLDISALVSSDTQTSGTSSAGGMGGGMGNGMQMFSLETQFTSQSQSLEIEEVYVTVGQKIEEGDVLYTLTAESVDKIRNTLQEDVNETLNEYETIQTEQKESRLQAQQGYETYITNGKYAQFIYDNELADLQEAVDDAVQAVNEKQDELNENLLELTGVQDELNEANVYLKEAEGAVSENYAGRYDNPYYYTVYENTRETAEALVEKLTEQVETLTEQNESLTLEIEAAMRKLNQANLELEKGKLTAKQTYDIDTYYADTASKWYQIQTESLNKELQNAKSSYEDAQAKLAEFDAYIVDNTVLAGYSGVVTQVELASGDSVSKDSGLIVLYDQEAVTMDVALSEEDFQSIDKEGSVNISYTAYPDALYTGVISEVSDAEYDSSTGGLYYTITITIQGDVSGLYEGMTGDVTFVTKETKEVFYVSNRAILRDGTRSYVKMYDADGNIIEKDVVTGFSDGVNVEIVEGLSDGDIALIEGKVSGQ
ncbi:MAG: HlyD family efflux transporter periplasmic adaptor subunit [Lachnospiraceae bacterium]|nr:HlyD family efflux transporter periplasmic adaptor subunit [Lachnospiraceae bacterium]